MGNLKLKRLMAVTKCLYCTVPDQVKYSTVIADEYRKVTEKIDYWRAGLGVYTRIYMGPSIYQPSISLVFVCLFFCLFFFKLKATVEKGESFLKFQSLTC